MNKIMKNLFPGIITVGFLLFWLIPNPNGSLAQFYCPSNTTYYPQTRTATLVGEIQDNGGDPNMQVWFEWGTSQLLGQTTPAETVYANQLPFRFCTTISNLQPCTTYYYRAVGRNSSDTTYGSIYSFKSSCLQVSVDIKANNSDGPVTIDYGNRLTISWTSTDANSCYASVNVIKGSTPNWSGSKTLSGNQSFDNLSIGEYNFIITCYGQNSSKEDSVRVIVRAKAPRVITLPAVETL